MSQNTASPNEKRQFKRLALSLPGRLALKGHALPVQIKDISLKGALVALEQDTTETTIAVDLTKDASGHLVILADPEEVPLLELNVQLLRDQSGMIAVTWPTIDLDNLTQLREILVINLADEALIERDLLELFRPA